MINDDILGSMEFACKVAGSKLIMVLGHSKCGAIKGACNHVELGHLTGLLDKVQPAIEKIKSKGQETVNPEFIEAVAQANTLHTMDEVLRRSPILKEMYENGEIGIAAGYYSVETGEVKIIKEKYWTW
ncbi:carbonic anhydrase [Paraflavitalea speifideaquila]|uniref:carbonic anhydrase n=1 Tax=Paraflavitalea speifideaquila TaxID=3076558 RepID=UPI0028EE2C60|nr:carbonic anhydrase [Paraflavitalea speifideiaquila]